MTNKFTKIKISDVTKTPTVSGFYDLTTSNWWAVTEDDCILLYKGYSRQCNSNKGIADRFVASDTHPSTKTVFLEAVWLPHNCSDY